MFFKNNMLISFGTLGTSVSSIFQYPLENKHSLKLSLGTAVPPYLYRLIEIVANIYWPTRPGLSV